MPKSLLTLLILSAITVGCGSPPVTGSGVSKSEDRSLSESIQSVSLYGIGQMKVIIGDQASLKVTADENMLQYVKSEVKDGRLSVGVGNGSYVWHNPPQCLLTIPGLKSMALAGQTQIAVEGLNEASLSIEADGQCSIVLSGTAAEQNIKLEGQCECDATGLKGTTAIVHSEGQCIIRLSSLQGVEGEIGGTTEVKYQGNPVLKIQTNGAAGVLLLQPEASR
ncbi:MAG: DUF2807 domain-containing protein [Planctomycetaceae bacterium]|nr:DUF2807 domain-containing protein [Planctomycetaceae bacterium]